MLSPGRSFSEAFGRGTVGFLAKFYPSALDFNPGSTTPRRRRPPIGQFLDVGFSRCQIHYHYVQLVEELNFIRGWLNLG